MEKARKQAEKVAPEDRESEAMKTLLAAAKLKKQASKDLTIALVDAEKAQKEFIANVPRTHLKEAIAVQNKVNGYLKELKEGANVNDIVNKLKKLRV